MNLKRPVTISRLEREIETLKDELLGESRTAEHAQVKLQSLQEEKEIMALSFKTSLIELQSKIADLKDSLQITTLENTELQKVVFIFKSFRTSC